MAIYAERNLELFVDAIRNVAEADHAERWTRLNLEWVKLAHRAEWGKATINLTVKRDTMVEAHVSFTGLSFAGKSTLYRTVEEAVLKAQFYHLANIWTDYMRKDRQWVRSFENILYRTVQTTNDDKHLEVGDDRGNISFLEFYSRHETRATEEAGRMTAWTRQKLDQLTRQEPTTAATSSQTATATQGLHQSATNRPAGERPAIKRP